MLDSSAESPPPKEDIVQREAEFRANGCRMTFPFSAIEII
jgi:hypothetical protein